MKPQRVQRRRTKGWKMPANTIYVGRGTKWGNPCRVGDMMMLGAAHTGTGKAEVRPATRADCKRYYAMKATGILLEYKKENLEPLRGKNLACWCPLDEPCHADILLNLANK